MIPIAFRLTLNLVLTFPPLALPALALRLLPLVGGAA